MHGAPHARKFDQPIGMAYVLDWISIIEIWKVSTSTPSAYECESWQN